MAKRWKKTIVHRIVDSDKTPLGYMIWCEGCGCAHAFYTEKANHLGARWDFNGDMNAPTFTPSMLVTTGHYIADHTGRCWCDVNREQPKRKHGFDCIRCHSFVTNGRMQFLADSTHKLRGQTVPLKPF